MRTRTEPLCNLTLTRHEWAVLVRLLDVRSELGVRVRQCVVAALRDEPGAASVGIERETDKWSGVYNAIHDAAAKRGGECRLLLRTMREQLQASEKGEQ